MSERQKVKLEEKTRWGQYVAQKGVAGYPERSRQRAVNFFTWGGLPRFACWIVLLATVQKM